MLASCTEKVFDLDDDDINEIKYQELPSGVKFFIDSNIDKIVRKNGAEYIEICYSTDPSIVFTCGRSGSSNNWISEVSSNYHHFFVDGVHYRMRGNKGHPFILDKGYLYFGDLHIYKDDYMKRPYYKIEVKIER